MFRKLVTQALQEKNLTVAQLADRVGVSQSAVYAWLAEKTDSNNKNCYKPKADKLLAISKELDIPLEKLIVQEEKL